MRLIKTAQRWELRFSLEKKGEVFLRGWRVLLVVSVKHFKRLTLEGKTLEYFTNYMWPYVNPDIYHAVFLIYYTRVYAWSFSVNLPLSNNFNESWTNMPKFLKNFSVIFLFVYSMNNKFIINITKKFLFVLSHNLSNNNLSNNKVVII